MDMRSPSELGRAKTYAEIEQDVHAINMKYDDNESENDLASKDIPSPIKHGKTATKFNDQKKKAFLNNESAAAKGNWIQIQESSNEPVPVKEDPKDDKQEEVSLASEYYEYYSENDEKEKKANQSSDLL